ncbi:hypothetical protein AN219_10430 [Streptomyces nanshensis]|nr:hypothetical protein AN219_10430 [Streptomyces nanshensis]
MTTASGQQEQTDTQILSRLWERNYDPHTFAIIDKLPLAPDWRCLDVGAGSGSTSRLLAERVPQGSVHAIDVDTSELGSVRAPCLSVEQLDVTQAEFEPGSFDLVLARAVVTGLPQAEQELTRMMRWLAPGGWLLVEDFYFLPSDDAPTAAGRAVVAAYTGSFRANGADMRLARRLPAYLAQGGLTSVDMRVRPLGPGQGADENELMRTRMELQGHRLVDSGAVTAAELDDFVTSLDRPESRDVTVLQFSVWGQRQPTG